MKTFWLLIVLLMGGLMAACDAVTGVNAGSAEHKHITPGNSVTPLVAHSADEWRQILTPEAYSVLREADTEPPFSGAYDHFFETGTYQCAACGLELFDSGTKFDSGSGWPSFYAPIVAERVRLVRDESSGELRVEVRCARCGSHLGHVFDDAPQTPTGKRFCMNSVALSFVPAKK